MLKFGRSGLGASTRLGWGKGVAGKGLRGEEWTLGGERRTWWAAFLGPGAGRHSQRASSDSENKRPGEFCLGA